MAHDNYRQMMSLVLDGLLPPADEAALTHHLDECAACAAAWDAMSGLGALFGQAAMVSPPPDFSARVMARVQARRVGHRWTERIFWLVMLALLAAVMLSQWVPTLVPVATSVGIGVPPGPLAELAGRLEPVLEVVRTAKAALTALGEALALWFTYLAGMPVAWTVALGTLVLVATWVGLIGVFSPGEPVPATREASQYA